MKNFLKWLLSFFEEDDAKRDPDFTCIQIPNDSLPVPITDINYQKHLGGSVPSDLRKEFDRQTAEISDADRHSLLVDMLCDSYYSVTPGSINKCNALRIKNRVTLNHMVNRSLEKKRVDAAVADALAKRDQEKRIDALTPAIQGGSVCLGEYGKLFRGEIPLNTPSVFDLLIDSFFGITVPKDVSPGQLGTWAVKAINALGRIDKNNPTYIQIKAQIDQHNKDVAEKIKMEGVITEMVRPTSIIKKPKVKTTK